MPQVLAAADLLVVASWAEPFGKVLVEAMALGKPVVGTAAGGVPEIIQDGQTGLLVPPRCPKALAGAMQRLAGNAEQAHNMGQRARRRVVERFGADSYVQQIQQLYMELLGE
jgi:glycosyltransferase involved in cell wall biosynthesis